MSHRDRCVRPLRKHSLVKKLRDHPQHGATSEHQQNPKAVHSPTIVKRPKPTQQQRSQKNDRGHHIRVEVRNRCAVQRCQCTQQRRDKPCGHESPDCCALAGFAFFQIVKEQRSQKGTDAQVDQDTPNHAAHRQEGVIDGRMVV